MRIVFVVVLIILSFACNNSTPAKESVSQSPTATAPGEGTQAGIKENNDWALLPFLKADAANPVLVSDSSATFNCPIIGRVKWEAKDVFNPAAVVRHDTIFLLFRAEDKVGKYAGTSRIGLAWSTDGLHFTKYPVPVLYPDNDSLKKYEWEGGCEDPRLVQDEHGTYFMTYTGYDGDKARLMVASSRDLYHWKKHGLAFSPGSVKSGWSKSGSIVSDYTTGTPIAYKVDGSYLMFWGDTDIFEAESKDLIHWDVITIPEGHAPFPLVSFIRPRSHKFDSDLVEPGPPAIITDSGILLLYNSRNVRSKGDSTLQEGTYAAGQLLFERPNALQIRHRMDSPFIKPDKPYEITGQVNNVCFVEGLVHYKGKWFLYYGTADSKIAVAVHE